MFRNILPIHFSNLVLQEKLQSIKPYIRRDLFFDTHDTIFGNDITFNELFTHRQLIHRHRQHRIRKFFTFSKRTHHFRILGNQFIKFFSAQIKILGNLEFSFTSSRPSIHILDRMFNNVWCIIGNFTGNIIFRFLFGNLFRHTHRLP